MADAPASQPQQDDMHWGISYLREDIQDLKQEIRALHQRIDSFMETTNNRFDAMNQRIDTKFGQLLAAMVAGASIIIVAVFAMFQAFLPAG